jgi:hypothetical protein
VRETSSCISCVGSQRRVSGTISSTAPLQPFLRFEKICQKQTEQSEPPTHSNPARGFRPRMTTTQAPRHAPERLIFQIHCGCQSAPATAKDTSPQRVDGLQHILVASPANPTRLARPQDLSSRPKQSQKTCHPDRSKAKRNCHPDRSEAQWRDLHLHPHPPT